MLQANSTMTKDKIFIAVTIDNTTIMIATERDGSRLQCIGTDPRDTNTSRFTNSIIMQSLDLLNRILPEHLGIRWTSDGNPYIAPITKTK